MKNISTDYEKDFHAWTLENAALLRQRRFAEIDVENIAEELENMVRGERHELLNRLAVLLAHLLKWRFQPARRGNSWKYTIEEQRRRIKRLLDENPSLTSRLEKAFENAYVGDRQFHRDALFDLEKRSPINLANIHCLAFVVG